MSVGTFAEVEPTDQQWVWEGWLPAGFLVPIIADPGASKTTLCADLLARVSRGDVMPDGSEGVPAGPVICAALEDDASTSMVKKLIASGADRGNVVNASGGPDGDGFELTLEGVEWLEGVIGDYPGCPLVVVDTLSASAPGSVTSNLALRKMLRPLNNMAINTGACVLLTCHTNKDGSPAGGQTLISLPRQVLTIAKSKTVAGERTLSIFKSNIAATDVEGIRYTLGGEGAYRTIEWAWDAVSKGSGPPPDTQKHIWEVLAASAVPMSPQLVAARSGCPYPSVRTILPRMVAKGTAAKTGRGAYVAVVPDQRS